MRKRRVLSVVCAAAVAVGMLAGCGGGKKEAAAPEAKTEAKAEAAPEEKKEEAKDDGQVYKLNFGHTLTEQDPFHQAYLKWAEAVNEKTGGKLQIEVYPSSQLGVEEDVLEQMKQGTNVGWQTDAARLGNYVNEFGVLLAPYCLDNMDEVKQLLDSPTIKEWEKKLEDEHNIKVISFAYVQGFRNIFSNKKGTSPEELKGVQIRTAGAPIWVAGIDSLGCKAVSLAYGEMYNGIQTKVVDGCELPYIAANNLKIQEVAKYILETQHIYQMNFMVCSADWYNSLPEEFQKILVEECDKAGLEVSEQMEKDSEANKQVMIDAGMEYVPFEEMDIEAFKKSSQAAYDKLNLNEAREAIYKELGKEIEK
ncbi:C4-dicarboxylate TRAP transporter substrate-binding protein [Clostridium sp. AM58-1XD]|uniref:C4-dicarboxylate TRAP transporter substrate-binding protein n=1 Tax=Clostridium sp. AM58-1XD TaxID=2292307 RepID=UPI000E551A87|nr:C4-dicarboxylate TRAP transporter substrate-binding protein [Clostridium sp. AM58-1XD]RGZ00387.1 C4-dicarboxylate ABC transporter [Clostridium sp. AM58-1XD]